MENKFRIPLFPTLITSSFRRKRLEIHLCPFIVTAPCLIIRFLPRLKARVHNATTSLGKPYRHCTGSSSRSRFPRASPCPLKHLLEVLVWPQRGCVAEAGDDLLREIDLACFGWTEPRRDPLLESLQDARECFARGFRSTIKASARRKWSSAVEHLLGWLVDAHVVLLALAHFVDAVGAFEERHRDETQHPGRRPSRRPSHEKSNIWSCRQSR